MNDVFDPRTGLIFIEAELSGPIRTGGLRFVLDTGATRTAIDVSVLRSVGYEPNVSTDRARMATGSRVEVVPLVTVNRIGALGRHLLGARVIAHDLPPEAAVDGLLGLDFFRGLRLELDFRAGRIALA